MLGSYCTRGLVCSPCGANAVIVARGRRDFIKNMITGASQADVALVMIPADGNSTTAIKKGNHKDGETQEAKLRSRLLILLGVTQSHSSSRQRRRQSLPTASRNCSAPWCCLRSDMQASLILSRLGSASLSEVAVCYMYTVLEDIAKQRQKLMPGSVTEQWRLTCIG